MTKAEALHIFATAITREILRGQDEPEQVTPAQPEAPYEGPPQPRFDFDESADVCEHGGMRIPRSECPVHGDEANMDVTPEELDDITSEEAPGPISRAKRIAEQRRKQAETERVYPEELPMSGLGPPQDLP